ncbi:ATP-grasp fold amidoligase family protein [Selenomonas sp. KH1T6]|uniref:ATP-grasp fold amidoligase family protein n=1 Tax=Selenomonas sp. KH1T6 TaxID=3158784 RepID=UPI0008A77BA4|nr:TupA-like ATPgrasp [Selenomonas ruminantium]
MNKIREDISKWPLEKRVDFLKQAFKKKMGYELNLENPRTFSEKIQWIKLFYRDPQMSRCADKVTFKDYIKEKLGRDDLTAELYMVWESPEEVDLSKIPDRCVIKSNCSSDGWNIKLVPDKSKVDLKALEAEIKESWFDRLALHTNSFANYYYAVKPKVYVEEYLADFAASADDYDVLCFHGEPKVICVKTNHFDNGKNLLDYPYTFYTTEWERMNVKYAINPTLEEVKRPAHLEEMLEISRTLSKDFPFVRVDFYEHDCKLRIAEFSFAPYAGMVHYEPEEFDLRMGTWLNVNNNLDGKFVIKEK